jgi:hypothetical protein
MHLIDVTGVRGTRFLVNLDRVRRITWEDFGDYAHVTFVYGRGERTPSRSLPGGSRSSWRRSTRRGLLSDAGMGGTS